MKKAHEISEDAARQIVRRLHEFLFKETDGELDADFQVSGAYFMKQAYEAFQDAGMTPDGVYYPNVVWYCDQCKQVVPGKHVTFQETHDVRYGGCGGPVK